VTTSAPVQKGMMGPIQKGEESVQKSVMAAQK
jgi:hypothetical protein